MRHYLSLLDPCGKSLSPRLLAAACGGKRTGTACRSVPPRAVRSPPKATLALATPRGKTRRIARFSNVTANRLKVLSRMALRLPAPKGTLRFRVVAGALGSAMILIVEDESIARHALSHLLHHSGFQIKAAASAEEALEIVNECGAPEAALVDLDLPGMDGLELIDRLSKQNPDVLSVLITAAPPERVEELKGANVSPDRYLRKPLKVADLLSLLTDLPRHA